MKAALAVNKVTRDVQANLAAMEQLAEEAADRGAELVLFPEAAVTGLINNDDPAHDLPLGQPVPGPATDRLAGLARRRSMYLATGILEREGDCLYDSAVLIDPAGGLALRHRRINPQWHGRQADPAVYRQGTTVGSAEAPWGRAAFAICGDLFDEAVTSQLRLLRVDYLLFPFARNFNDGSFDQARWDREEAAAYAAAGTWHNCTTLMVNLIEDPDVFEYASFGGAMVVSAEGRILASRPLGMPGVLLADV